MEECLLICEGAKLCDFCKPEDTWKYHGARYIIPFSIEFNHFEVIIQYFLQSFTLRKGETEILFIVTHVVKVVKDLVLHVYMSFRAMSEKFLNFSVAR